MKTDHRISFRFALLLTLCSSLLAQVKDVDGWNKVKWGMSIDEVRRVYGAGVLDINSKDSRLMGLTLPNITVGDIEMHVTVNLSDDSKRIKNVELEKLFITGDRDRGYDAIKGLLIDKYGAPVSDVNRNGASSAQWIFPSTQIMLDTFGTGGLEIVYKPSDKKALDVL